jgi:type VI secretion system protein ImpG
MSDELLAYYNRELAYFRKMAGEFAETHPKIAGRLRITGEMVEDPHVSRLIESFAYLNARTRRKIDDDFPELSEAILSVLYPHYLAPFPSCAIVRFNLHPDQIDLNEGYLLPRGAGLETQPIDGEPCRFRTSHPVRLWPISIQHAAVQGAPFTAPAVAVARDAQSIVHLQLKHYSSEVPFSALKIESLRFFLNGSTQSIYDLYELLHNDCLGVAIASSTKDANPVLLSRDAIRPVGFEREEGLIDYSARSSLGYRLLTEYFAFPEKFLFFDLTGMSERVLASAGAKSDLHIFIYLKRHLRDVEKNISTHSFQLGCAPVVNLFQQRAEPIHLDNASSEYRVVPDARRPLANEVYSVQRVIATSPTNERIEYLPFYSTGHHGSKQACYWYAARRYTQSDLDRGSEIFLNLVNLDYETLLRQDWTLDVDTLCLNRDLPGRLPVDVQLHLTTGAEMAQARCLVPPTQTFRPALRQGTLWRLISHLSLNHLSLADGEHGAEALREILKLYDMADSAATRSMIDGLKNVESRRVVGRIGGHVSGGFCRGTEIALHFDEEKFSGMGLYLFASVLERFIGLYTSINSFTRTKITSMNRRGVICEWPPRSGEKVLV